MICLETLIVESAMNPVNNLAISRVLLITLLLKKLGEIGPLRSTELRWRGVISDVMP